MLIKQTHTCIKQLFFLFSIILFQTPVNRPPIPASATVTPKVNMNEPISMMRRPNQGEVALSMTGSPLMVSAVSRDDMATISVPLANGNVRNISIYPIYIYIAKHDIILTVFFFLFF